MGIRMRRGCYAWTETHQPCASGGFSEVFLGTGEDGKAVAVKRFRKLQAGPRDDGEDFFVKVQQYPSVIFWC